jgi:hypothetical protein
LISSIACEAKRTLFSFFNILQAQCFLRAFLVLLVFYLSIRSLFDFCLILLFFPSLTFYTHLVFF